VVEKLEKKLKEYSTSKVAVFHSGMPLLNRDRQAAYFAEEEGAQLLLCTEIGSEGRNFEFAKNLILFDLPRLPDLLEQRIGRLDRIGQKNDIHLYVPYFKDSTDEALFRWYQDGLDAFATFPRGATEVYAHIREEWVTYLNACEEKEKMQPGLDAIIKKTKKIKNEVEEKLDHGQDRLVELNSFNPVKAEAFVKLLKTEDEALKLKPFMMNLFNQLGVDVDDLDADSFFIRPGDNMYMPVFPSLPNEGIGITFNRAKAIRKEELTFITWDHPMVKGIIDFVESKEMGNVSIATWKNKPLDQFMVEGFLILNVKAPSKMSAETFFPPTPLRVLLNNKFVDKTKEISKKKMDDEIINLPMEKREMLKQIPKEFIKTAALKLKECAMPRAKQYKEQFMQEMSASLQAEIKRLVELKAINPSVRDDELVFLKMKLQTLEKAFESANLTLDSIRIIF
jgi:ATP-dependent helicase HepA